MPVQSLKSNRIKIIFWVLIAVLITSGAACYAVNLRVNARTRQINRMLTLGDKTLARLKEDREEINQSLNPVRAAPRDNYPAFRRNYNRRIREYNEMEDALARVDASLEPVAGLKSLLGRMIGLNRSLDLAYVSVVDIWLFAPEQRAGQAWMIRPDTVAGDIFKCRQLYEKEAARLRGAGRLDRLRMPQHRRMRENPGRDQKVNIIFLLVDALRAGDLGAYGSSAKCSPFLDRIARQGVVFEDVTSPSADTYTSVSSIFSGMNPFATNSYNTRKWDSSRSLIPRLRRAGYRTAGFSANSLVSSLFGFNRGFDSFNLRSWLPAVVVYNEVATHVEYARRAEGRNPFFLYIHIIDPHAPYTSPDTIRKAAGARPASFLLNVGRLHQDEILKGINPADVMPPGNLEYLRNAYTQEVSYADKWIQKMFTLFQSYEMLENTLIVITADHGEAFLEHGDLDHAHQLFQEQTHVPLILWGRLPPGLRPGTRIRAPHSSLEIMPSLLAWQGIPAPGPAALRSTLFSAHKHPEPIISTAVGHSFDMKAHANELISMRRGKYKLILDTAADQCRLFDLESDPGERNDLSDVRSALALSMKKQILEIKVDSLKANPHGRKKEQSQKLRKELKTLGYIE